MRHPPRLALLFWLIGASLPAAAAPQDRDGCFRVAPPDFAVLVNRSALYAAKREDAAAIADFTEAIRLNPQYVDAYTRRGLAYQDRGETERAVADYREAVRRDGSGAASGAAARAQKALGLAP